jgi:BolA protein
VAEALRTRLASLEPLVLDIQDDSAQHVGHAGAAAGGGHFSLLIVSKVFSGRPRLARHREVLDRVGDLIPHPVHALAIAAYAPDEFESPSQPQEGLHA